MCVVNTKSKGCGLTATARANPACIFLIFRSVCSLLRKISFFTEQFHDTIQVLRNLTDMMDLSQTSQGVQHIREILRQTYDCDLIREFDTDCSSIKVNF